MTEVIPSTSVTLSSEYSIYSLYHENTNISETIDTRDEVKVYP